MDSQFIGIEAEEARRFCQLLALSGLVSPDDLASLLRQYCHVNPEPSSQSASSLSCFLISRGVITAWQAEKLRDGRYKGFFVDNYLVLERVAIYKKHTRFAALDTTTNRRVLLAMRPPDFRAGHRKPEYHVLDEPCPDSKYPGDADQQDEGNNE